MVLEETLVIEAGKTVVLDLNGKSISQVKACTGNYNMIYNKGNLTITGNGKISFTDIGAGDPKFGWGSYTIRNEGTLVVENGTIENLSAQNPDPASGKVVHMYCAIFQYSGSTTINGGKISTPTYRSVRLWKGEMTINGGEFEGQVWIQAVDSTAKMTITGGTFAPRGVDGSSVFVGNIDNSGKLHVVDLKVTGGTFTTKIGANDVASLNGPITGGTFTAAAMQYTNADLINSEYEFTQNADGSYGVELHIHTEKTTVETVDATCTTAGYTKTTVICETCGETISETVEEIAALGHTEEIIPGKAATCTETGLTEGKKCTVCGEVLTAQEVIPATGHEYDENGTDTDCNICGAARPTVIVDGNTVSVQLNGVEIVKTHTFYVEGKNVDINNWAELKATGTLKSFKTSEFVLADAGAYVLRVEYLDKDGVRQAVSYTAEIATSLVPASKPEFVVKDNIVSVKANGATNIKVYAFYVEGKEVADINYWEALKAADPNFKTYSKGVIPLTKVGKYVLRAEYLDANGVKNVESFEVNIASVPVSLTVLENSVTVNVDGATNVKVFAFYVEGKSVSNIYNWSELKTVDPNFKTYVKNSFTLPEAGKYVLRVQYTNAQGEIVAVSYMANTSVITPAVVKDGNKIKLTTNGLTVKKVHVYYVEGAEIADINDWQELMAEAVSFKTYIKTPFYLNESGDYVVRIEYVDVKGATRIVSQAITV